MVAFACSAEVPNPLRVAARSDDVSGTTEAERVDGRAARDAGLAAADFEDARAPEADTDAGESGDDPVEEVASEPPRSALVRVRTHRGHATPPRPVAQASSPRSSHRAGRALLGAAKRSSVLFRTSSGFVPARRARRATKNTEPVAPSSTTPTSFPPGLAASAYDPQERLQPRSAPCSVHHQPTTHASRRQAAAPTKTRKEHKDQPRRPENMTAAS